jgi:hypothetical protein
MTKWTAFYWGLVLGLMGGAYAMIWFYSWAY